MTLQLFLILVTKSLTLHLNIHLQNTATVEDLNKVKCWFSSLLIKSKIFIFFKQSVQNIDFIKLNN